MPLPLSTGFLMGLFDHIGRLSHPAFQAAVLAVAAAFFIGRHRYRAAGGLLAIATLWLWLCSTPAFAAWLQHGLEHPYRQQNAAAYPVADAIVVLGGGKLPRSGIDWSVDEVDTQATRLGFGLQLFLSGRADTILLSGGDQALDMARKLREQGVPASAMLTEDTSENTHQNASNSAGILGQKNLRRILLVTSGIHMPRASASFTREGLTVIPAPAIDPVHSLRKTHRWWPQRAALTMSARCLRERLGLWGYRWRGWA
jgi:uncharacterized SAM-binding protein YcdF (DUF218 family)